ncbi:hypothetical protein BD410DRAFT_606875 [Rickenella mellea]|uniref:Uncharacterized protein n=1 Tax=Rickenella mellea TaxID=50990 RepID=A0A4Y7QFW4_9AGAM|nr:hypothetical protein BD410DRAFT_606875 [Rickenella mellea]
MNRPRASILTLFDPLHAPSTSLKDGNSRDDDSDKENSTPERPVPEQACGQTTMFFQSAYARGKDRKAVLPRSPRGLLVDIDEEPGWNESVDDTRSRKDRTPGGKAHLREIRLKNIRSSHWAHRSTETGMYGDHDIKSNAGGSEHSRMQSSVQNDQNVSAPLHTEPPDSLTMVINSINRPTVTLTRPPSPPDASLPCADSTPSPAPTLFIPQSPTICLSKLNASGTSLLSPSISLSPSTAFLIPSPTGKLLTRSKLSMVVEDEEDEEKIYPAESNGRQAMDAVVRRNDASDTPPLSLSMPRPLLQQSHFNASFDLMNDEVSFFSKMVEDLDLDSNTSATNNARSQAEDSNHLATSVSKAVLECLHDGVVNDNPPNTIHPPQAHRKYPRYSQCVSANLSRISGYWLRTAGSYRAKGINGRASARQGRSMWYVYRIFSAQRLQFKLTCLDFTVTIHDNPRVDDSQLEHSQVPSIQIRSNFNGLVPCVVKPLRIQKLKPKVVEQVSRSESPKPDAVSSRVVAIKPSRAQRPPPGMICAIPPAIGRSADSRLSPALNAMDHVSVASQPRRVRQVMGAQSQVSESVAQPVAQPKGAVKGTPFAIHTEKSGLGNEKVGVVNDPTRAARKLASQTTTRVGQPTPHSSARPAGPSTLPVPIKKGPSSGIPRPASSNSRLPAPGYRSRETWMMK